VRKLCPGQDTRFWRPEDIFEIDCEACGTPVEFFKDDVYRRCTHCGRRIENPRFNLGCAQWCEHARECLGYDPKDMEPGGSGRETLVDRLVDAMRRAFGEGDGRIAHGVRAQEFAREILRFETADARPALAASLLSSVGGAAARDGGGAPVARRLLEEAGVDGAVRDEVCRIVECLHGACALDTPAGRVAEDADRLAILAAGGEGIAPEREASFAKSRFHTEAGRELARRELARSRGGRDA